MMCRRAAAVMLVAGLAGPAAAQVLHERIVVGAVQCEDGVCWHKGAPGDAAAIVVDGQVLPAPPAGAPPAPDEPVYGAMPDPPPAASPAVAPGSSPAAGGSGAPPPPEVPGAPSAAPAGAPPADVPPLHRARVAMDRETGPEPPGTRVYHEPFNPAVFPFKRMTALDAVGADEALMLAPRSNVRQRLRVVGAERRQAGRDAFWGSIVVDFQPGAWVPLPSPAPDARILAARTEPEADVLFARDGADNQYVTSSASGRHRLVWLVDAPERYFAGAIPRAVRLRDEPLLPAPVPARVAERARKVLARIGVDARPGASLARAVDALVAWFRAFSPGDPPPSTGSTYLDLALGQRGSCRHRSYAFVITALAAGIPARYVENELHVFVEVYVPDAGWRRINLGGALVDEEVAGADGKVPYVPKGGDPFPQPPAFANGPDATPPAPRALAEAEAHRGGPSGDGHGGPGGRVDLDRLDRDEDGGAGASASAPGNGGASGRRTAPAPVATRVSVAVGARDTFRGDRVDVSGVVESADGKPAGLPVEIYLDGPGGALRVGDAVAGPDGRWRAQIVVPRDLPVGDHRVVARTPGDATRRASHSR